MDPGGNAWITRCAGCDLALYDRDIVEQSETLEEFKECITHALHRYRRRQLDSVPQPPYLPPPSRGDAAAGPPSPPADR